MRADQNRSGDTCHCRDDHNAYVYWAIGQDETARPSGTGLRKDAGLITPLGLRVFLGTFEPIVDRGVEHAGSPANSHRSKFAWRPAPAARAGGEPV